MTSLRQSRSNTSTRRHWKIQLPRPHRGQRSVLDEVARYNTLCCGRRFGKTILGINLLVEPALTGKPVAWFSPTYKMLLEVWREALRILKPLIVSRDTAQRRLELVNGAVIDFWSLQNADSIRGRKYARIVIDEAAMVSDLATAWQEVIRPTLTDYRGDAFFLSTPKGRNFFWELFQRGKDPEKPDWAAFQLPTSCNPFINADELAAAQAELPENVWLQEYLAQFLDGLNGVFRNVAGCSTATGQTAALSDHSYIFGVDWARSGDYTVISVIDATTREQVYLDRFTQVDYELQVGRLKGLANRFRPNAIIAEANSMGGPLVERLRREGLPVQPFTTTNASKVEAIDGLVLAFENSEIAILDDAVQTGELLSYEQDRLPSGMIRYGAPKGLHDDMVMALALANYGLGRPAAQELIGFV